MQSSPTLELPFTFGENRIKGQHFPSGWKDGKRLMFKRELARGETKKKNMNVEQQRIILLFLRVRNGFAASA